MTDAASAVMWGAATVLVYLGAVRIYRRWHWSLLHPTLVSIVLLISLLRLTGTSVPTYDLGGRWLGVLLGPSVVALGVPLALQWDAVLRQRRSIVLSVLVGSIVGMVAATGTAALLGGDALVVRSLASRSVTTAIAVEIARSLRGIPSLSAAISVGSGVLGAVIGPPILRFVGVRRSDSWGFAMGAAAHGIGTARAAERGPESAAAAGLATALMGLATGALAALAARLFV